MTGSAITPGAVLGVLGGGQLGRMFALEAIRMGYTVWVLDADPMSPAGRIAHRHLQAAYDDAGALAELGAGCAAITTEFENVPAQTLQHLQGQTRVAPEASALEVAQDRRREKSLFADCGVPTVQWASIESPADVSSAWNAVNGSGILKTARMGYDGKGQIRCESRDELAAGFAALGGVACVFEQRVTLAAEVSVVVARATGGHSVSLPVGENCHRDGILHTTTVPAQVDESVQNAARATAEALAASLGYCGVLAVEFFVTTDGELLANEIAPRPHNSGHYSQLGCAVNQFELQVRTLCNLPLVQPTLQQPTAMVNLLGDVWSDGEPDWSGVVALEGAELHLYGKQAARPGRKMGHINVCASSVDERDQILAATCSVLGLAV